MPRAIIADRFNADTLKDNKVKKLILRMPRWKESTNDIRGLRKLALDGNLAIDANCRPLLQMSLTAGRVVNDEHGGTRFEKSGVNNQGRDDVAQALIFAAGMVARMRPKGTGSKVAVPA